MFSLIQKTMKPASLMARQVSLKRVFHVSSITMKQNTVRPVSPHLTIYQPQLTWYMSAAHRITAVGLAGGTYLGGILYALVPFSSSAVVSSLYALPGFLIFFGKFLVSVPYTFHSFNGIRHLFWDMGYFLSLKNVYFTGYAVNALTLVSTLALCAM